MIHASSVAVSREHRRAKTDRLDTELLKRAFLGWLRGERGHCSMARVPTIAEEDAKRPNRERDCHVGERTRIVNRIKSTLARLGIRNFKPTLRKAAERLATVHTPEGMPLPPNTLAELQRDMARLSFVVGQIREIENARQKRLEQEAETGPHAMVRLLARIVGVGVETADMLVHELLSRPMRDRRAVARYAGLTGSPDESGAQRREQGLARAGNARVRRGMIQLAWRFLMFQKESALAVWYRARTADSRIGTPELRAEGARNPSLDHVHAPNQERNCPAEIHQCQSCVHLACSRVEYGRPPTYTPAASRRAHRESRQNGLVTSIGDEPKSRAASVPGRLSVSLTPICRGSVHLFPIRPVRPEELSVETSPTERSNRYDGAAGTKDRDEGDCPDEVVK